MRKFSVRDFNLYPRARGAGGAPTTTVLDVGPLPPRTRGRHARRAALVRENTSTPAHAGPATFVWILISLATLYPRARGAGT